MKKKDEIQLLIVGALSVILLVLLFKQLGRKEEKETADTTKEYFKEHFIKDTVPQEVTLYAELEKEALFLTSDRDPFVVVEIVKEVGPALRGVMWDENDPVAIVDDKTVGVGDMVRGKVVAEIKPQSVVLRDPDGIDDDLELFLNKSSD